MRAGLGVALPVEAKKRLVFTFSCREPLTGFPLLIDPTRRLCAAGGRALSLRDGAAGGRTTRRQPISRSTTPSSRRRSGRCWPRACRPSSAIKPGRAWAGHYDFNTFDQNAIVGRLPGFANLLVATGFSGHGLQQAPAVGRGLAELIVHGRYRSLDLSPLGFERIAAGRPLVEENVRSR